MRLRRYLEQLYLHRLLQLEHLVRESLHTINVGVLMLHPEKNFQKSARWQEMPIMPEVVDLPDCYLAHLLVEDKHSMHSHRMFEKLEHSLRGVWEDMRPGKIIQK